jgi:hypothetical protein
VATRARSFSGGCGGMAGGAMAGVPVAGGFGLFCGWSH